MSQLEYLSRAIRIKKIKEDRTESGGLSVNTKVANLFLSMLTYSFKAEKVIQKLHSEQCGHSHSIDRHYLKKTISLSFP